MNTFTVVVCVILYIESAEQKCNKLKIHSQQFFKLNLKKGFMINIILQIILSPSHCAKDSSSDTLSAIAIANE